MALTLAQQTARVKRLARTENSGAVTTTDTDDVIKYYINEGVREFSKETSGEPAEDYLQVTPRFDIRTYFAIRLTIGATIAAADVAITDTDRSDTTGAQVATDLQVAIRAMTGAVGDETVAFTTSGDDIWTFLITDPTGGDITIAAPSDPQYVNAVSLLFGGADLTQDDTFRGQIGEDATVEADLPSTFLNIERVEWNRQKLWQAPFDLFISPQTTGTPQYYAIKNEKIRIYPTPTSQGLWHIRFKEAPADLATDGTADGTSCPLPNNEHMAPVYYAASKLLEERYDMEQATHYYSLFYRMVSLYKMREANQNPALFPSAQEGRNWPYDVET